ncbi:uncharacterized protein LOC144937926 isoform X1 [Lampetra fluviatilis]
MDIKTAAAAQGGAAAASAAAATTAGAGGASGDGSHRPSATDAGGNGVGTTSSRSCGGRSTPARAGAVAAAGAGGGRAGGASGRGGDGDGRPVARNAGGAGGAGDPTAAPAGESDVGPASAAAAAAAAAPTTAEVGGGVAADGAHGGQKLTCPAAETSAGSTAKAKRRSFYLGDRMRVASTAKSGPDHGYDVCFNFLRHAFDTLLLFFLGLCSPALRVILDVLGLGGGVFKYGLYGMAIFLVSVYGLSFVFTLMRTYIVETSIVFAVLQCLVLAVSLRNSDC